MEWINGRQLKKYMDSSKNLNITYQYNQDGIRTSKMIGNSKTKYYLEGLNIIYEQRGENLIYYLYDGTGIIGLKYNGNYYYYIKNVQGDVVGILDSSYNKVVSYEYDSFGKILSIKDNNGNEITDITNIGIINPFRYRSYYYDEETGLYYLNSRYYSPIWRRFINADGIIGANKDILGYNLYAYCSNNPVIGIDLYGSWGIDIESIWESICDFTSGIIDGFSEVASSICGGMTTIIGSVVNVKYTYNIDYNTLQNDDILLKYEVGGSYLAYEDVLFGNDSALITINFEDHSDKSKRGGSIGVNTFVGGAKLNGSKSGMGISAAIRIKDKEYNAGVGIEGWDAYYQFGVDYNNPNYKGSFYGKFSGNWVMPTLGYVGAPCLLPALKYNGALRYSLALSY